MENILTIDNGNTNPHVGVFEGQSLKQVLPLDKISSERSDVHLHPVILSNVGKEISSLKGHPNLTKVGDFRQERSFLEMQVNYSETLGEDRLISAYNIYKKEVFSKNLKRVLLIDAGTFLTFDFIGTNGLEGGFILPGTQIFLESYGRGENLPSLNGKELNDSPLKLGKTTNEAITEGTKLYLKSVLKELLHLFPAEKIVLTGGNGEFLKSFLEEDIATELYSYEPHLIHKALHLLYESSQIQRSQ